MSAAVIIACGLIFTVVFDCDLQCWRNQFESESFAIFWLKIESVLKVIAMAEEHYLFDYSSNQQNDRRPIWKPKETKPAAKTSVILSVPAPSIAANLLVISLLWDAYLNCDCARLTGAVALLLVILIPKFGANAGLD